MFNEVSCVVDGANPFSTDEKQQRSDNDAEKLFVLFSICYAFLWLLFKEAGSRKREPAGMAYKPTE